MGEGDLIERPGVAWPELRGECVGEIEPYAENAAIVLSAALRLGVSSFFEVTYRDADGELDILRERFGLRTELLDLRREALL